MRGNEIQPPREATRSKVQIRSRHIEPYPVPDTEKETTSFLCGCGEKYSYTVAPRL